MIGKIKLGKQLPEAVYLHPTALLAGTTVPAAAIEAAR